MNTFLLKTVPFFEVITCEYGSLIKEEYFVGLLLHYVQQFFELLSCAEIPCVEAFMRFTLRCGF